MNTIYMYLHGNHLHHDHLCKKEQNQTGRPQHKKTTNLHQPDVKFNSDVMLTSLNIDKLYKNRTK